MTLAIGSITIDCDDPGRLGAFWSAVLGTPIQSSFGDFVLLQRPPQGGPFVMLQRVPESRVGKNSLHLDLTGEPRTQAAARLTALGATMVAEHAESGSGWTVMADPEGTSSASADPRPAPAS